MTADPGTPSSAPALGASTGSPGVPRRLTRSRHDRWIAGVAGGIASYLNVDPVLARLALVVLAIASGGVAVLFYIIAIFVVPEDASVGDTGGRRASAAGLIFGAVLVAIGGIWLLSALDVAIPRWDILLAGALIVVGAALLATAGRAGTGGLIALGLILTVVLSGLSAVRLPIDRAFTDSTQRPTSLATLQRQYSHAFGSFTLDLSAIELPEGTTRIRVSTSFGDTRVRLPARAAARVQTSTVFGEARVLGETFSGVGTNQTRETPDYASAPRRLEIELDTAFGSAEVTR